jgi:hypothetical protein
LAGLQQLSELFLVHLDDSLGSSATKRNAKDGGKREKVRWTRCEEKRFYLLRLEGKKKKNKMPDSIQQGLFLPRFAEGSVPSFQDCQAARSSNSA